MIRLIVTDVDGTLVEDGSSFLNPEYYETILQLREMGIQVAAASGRKDDSLIKLFAPVKDKMFFLSDNGAAMCTSKRILSTTAIRESLLRELLEDCQKLSGCDVLLSGVKSSYCFEGASPKFLSYVIDGYHFNVTMLEDFSHLPTVIKVAIYHDPSQPHPALFLLEKWKGKLDGVVSGNEWVDFTMPGVSKGSALQLLQESLGILPEETMVFGDQLNDLSMMARSAHSYAVGGARQEVRDAAAHVTAPREEDGVLVVWKELLNRKGEPQ